MKTTGKPPEKKKKKPYQKIIKLKGGAGKGQAHISSSLKREINEVPALSN